MARRFGTINKLAVDIRNYDYIINGTGGIGKTHLAVEVGRLVTGSDEGTLVITLGLEPVPKHLNNAFYVYAEDWSALEEIAEDLIENKQDYPHTVWLAFDSLDELFRLSEQETVRIWNKKNPTEKVDSISQAFKGFQKGENHALKLVLELRQKLRLAGYKFFDLGHTKEKGKVDMMQDVEFKQVTNKLESKYYDAIKDKSAIACVAYDECNIQDISEVRDAFTKGKKKVGNLIDKKRVICFRDDDFTCDTKSYFKHIVSKIDFSPENFIKAVEDAIRLESEEIQAKAEMVADLPTAEQQQADQTPAPSPKKEKAEQPTLDKASLLKELQAKCADKSVLAVAMEKMKELECSNFKEMTAEQLQELITSL